MMTNPDGVTAMLYTSFSSRISSRNNFTFPPKQKWLKSKYLKDFNASFDFINICFDPYTYFMICFEFCIHSFKKPLLTVKQFVEKLSVTQKRVKSYIKKHFFDSIF